MFSLYPLSINEGSVQALLPGCWDYGILSTEGPCHRRHTVRARHLRHLCAGPLQGMSACSLFFPITLKAILAHIPSDAVSFSLVARCQELHSKAHISVFSIFCTSAASGLRSRAELKGQERQVRRVWRRQLIVQNSGRNLQ